VEHLGDLWWCYEIQLSYRLVRICHGTATELLRANGSETDWDAWQAMHSWRLKPDGLSTKNASQQLQPCLLKPISPSLRRDAPQRQLTRKCPSMRWAVALSKRSVL
jgi:hypothetical protein